MRTIDANLMIGRGTERCKFLVYKSQKVTMIVLVPGYRYIFATNKCGRQIIGKVTVIGKQHRRSHMIYFAQNSKLEL